MCFRLSSSDACRRLTSSAGSSASHYACQVHRGKMNSDEPILCLHSIPKTCSGCSSSPCLNTLGKRCWAYPCLRQVGNSGHSAHAALSQALLASCVSCTSQDGLPSAHARGSSIVPLNLHRNGGFFGSKGKLLAAQLEYYWQDQPSVHNLARHECIRSSSCAISLSMAALEETSSSSLHAMQGSTLL